MRFASTSDPESESPTAGKQSDGPDRGRNTAMLGPSSRAGYPHVDLRHAVTVVGDSVGPVIPVEHWECIEDANPKALLEPQGDLFKEW